MTLRLPTASRAKELAKELRVQLASQGEIISHAAALERIAKRYGFRDWNAFHASLRAAGTMPWPQGSAVTGIYLGQRFSGVIQSIREDLPGWHRLDIKLDEAVDVVKFESFSNMRHRINATVGPKGHSEKRTSDGVPHLQMDPLA